MAQNTKLLYGLNDKPGFWKFTFLGLQHVMLVFSESVLMPVVICRSTGTSPEQTEYIIFATIIITAVSSFIQVRRFGKIGAGYLLFMGSSGVYWGAVANAVDLHDRAEELLDTEPEKLGLILVKRLTTHFEHQHISGHNYISIEIEE